jgi:glucan phosphoethanolaminetransferase (alkaline phosphatase superfamily)
LKEKLTFQDLTPLINITFKEGIIMKCEKCSTEITPWMLFRGFNSYRRFSCSQCKTYYKINPPHPLQMTIGVPLLAIILVLAGFPVIEHFGYKFLIPYVIFCIALFCALEYLGDMYLLRKGTLEAIEVTKPTITPALFYVIAFVVLAFGFLMLTIPLDLPSKDLASFTIFVIILFLQIVLIGMVFGVKSDVEKLKDEIKEQQRSTDDN